MFHTLFATIMKYLIAISRFYSRSRPYTLRYIYSWFFAFRCIVQRGSIP